MFKRKNTETQNTSIQKEERKKPGKKETPPTEDQARQAGELNSKFGCTADDLASFFNVPSSAITRWWQKGRNELIKDNPYNPYAQFLLECKRGADEFNTNKIEKVLVKRAEGYDYKTKKKEKTSISVKNLRRLGIEVPSELVEKGEVVYAEKLTEIENHVPADTKAIIYWLSNRAKERWQMYQVNKTEGKVDHRHLHGFVGGVNKKEISNAKMNPSKLSSDELEQVERIVEAQDNEQYSE